MEKIIRIEDQPSFTLKKDDYTTYEGYFIITDKQTIKIGIGNDSNCCESWGYLASADNLEDFQGAEIKSIALVDEAANEKIIKDAREYGLDEGDAMVVNIDTDKGLLQFAVYNSHNGYYSHSAVVISHQVSREKSL